MVKVHHTPNHKALSLFIVQAVHLQGNKAMTAKVNVFGVHNIWFGTAAVAANQTDYVGGCFT